VSEPVDNTWARRLAESIGELRAIAQHPAFRLGVLDAQAGKPLDHDLIAERLAPFDGDVKLAQYRYEEGRIVAVKYGVRVRAWPEGDALPKGVRVALHQIAADNMRTGPL
jgi:hypothetical protein